MKIDKIIIQNINSIENAEISFSTGILAKEQLFLVTGEIGSGKTTILDAITLALYDKSPRYENIKNKEKTEDGQTTVQSTTNVLRKCTNDGKAEVWFTIGNDSYIATWQMHKTRTGKYDMSNRRKLEVVKGDERIVLETRIDAVNQQIIDLVGLTYDQFIRSVLLAQGQFNTFLVSEKAKQTEILEMLTGTEIYSRIADIIGQKKNTAKTDAVNAKNIYDSYENSLRDIDITSIQDDIAKNKDILEKTEADIKKHEQDLRNIEYLEKLHLDIDNSKSQLADLQASYERLLDEKTLLSKQRDELKKQIDEQSAKSSINEKLPLILSFIDKLGSSDTTYDSKEQDFSELSTKLAEAETTQMDANAAYEECNTRLEKADPDRLQNAKNKHNDELANQEERKRKYQRVKQILNDYLAKKQIIDNNIVELNDLKHHFNICEDTFKLTKSAFEAKDSEYQIQKNMVADFMKSLRSKLEDGKPCPLCGSTSHQYHDEKVVDSLFASIEKAWNEARSAFESAKDAKNKAESEINLRNRNIENDQKQLDNLVKNLTNECNGKPIYDIELLEKGLTDCESKISDIKAKIVEINEKIQKANAIKDELKQLQKKKNDADEAYKLILRKLAFKWKRLNDEYSKMDSEITKIDEIINAIRRIEGIDSIEEFKGKVATRNDIDKNSLISGFSKVIFNLIEKTKEAKVVENQLGEKANLISKSEISESLKALESQKAALSTTITELSSKLSIIAQKQAESAAAKDDWEAKSSILELWTELANAIGTTNTSNFRDVAQAYTLRILLDQANLFLRKLSHRYELTCYSDSLAIMVMDNEMGGELRSASSLSGGETFLVSLALALGLAALNDENLNIDMLFIDEGFGSLDGESLEMAVQTLENMQNFGKKVGIISHVESLKDRIPAQILVTKRGKAASEVIIMDK